MSPFSESLRDLLSRGGAVDEAADGWLALPAEGLDETVKPAPYLPIYEQLLRPLRDSELVLLELGVWKGHSLAMWRDAFPNATIVGVDLRPPELDLGPRVHVVEGDQTDAALMRTLRERFAPGGFDVIIDDASHFAEETARSLQVLYAEHLRGGGVYCIEDWGTGYMPDWEDGGRIEEPIDTDRLDEVAAPGGMGGAGRVAMTSHNLGMVGLIKRLVDHSARNTARHFQPGAVGQPLEIETMQVWDGIVALRKPATAPAAG
jgi:hypothetical protein